MSIDDVIQQLEEAARSAVLQAKAVAPCPLHADVLIRAGDPDAEKHAYALATVRLKGNGTMFLREDLMSSIKDELGMAADGECPQCAHLRGA